MSTIDGRWLTENERMAMLRAEELEALGMWEIPNNALVTARLSPVSPEAASPPGPRPPPTPAKVDSNRVAGSVEIVEGLRAVTV